MCRIELFGCMRGLNVEFPNYEDYRAIGRLQRKDDLVLMNRWRAVIAGLSSAYRVWVELATKASATALKRADGMIVMN